MIAAFFLVKERGQCNYYLVNDYMYHYGVNILTYRCQTYTTDAVARVKHIYGRLPNIITPMHNDSFIPT